VAVVAKTDELQRKSKPAILKAPWLSREELAGFSADERMPGLIVRNSFAGVD